MIEIIWTHFNIIAIGGFFLGCLIYYICKKNITGIALGAIALSFFATKWPFFFPLEVTCLLLGLIGFVLGLYELIKTKNKRFFLFIFFPIVLIILSIYELITKK